MPEKIISAPTVTCARPPRIQPKTSRAKLKMRSVMPLMLSRLPATTKNGTARSAKLSTFSIIMRGSTSSGVSVTSTPTKAATPTAMLTGMPSVINASMVTIIASVPMVR